MCPATDQDYAVFQSTFETALGILDRGLLSSRLFVAFGALR